jgi:hypothetical protein
MLGPKHHIRHVGDRLKIGFERSFTAFRSILFQKRITIDHWIKVSP